MTTPRKAARVLVVTARNRRHGGTETRRWTDRCLTRDDAIAYMGYWLTQLGWDVREIQITNAEWHIEDEQSGLIHMRLTGE